MSYTTPEFTKLLIEENPSGLSFTGHLINSSSTTPGSSVGKSYFIDIAADEATGYTSQTLTNVTASISASTIIFTCDDIIFSDASSAHGPIDYLVVRALINDNNDSPFCVVNLTNLTESQRTPDDTYGLEFTCGNGGFVVYEREVTTHGYVTSEFGELILSEATSSLDLTAHLITSSSTTPLSIVGKSYYDDIEADEAGGYVPPSITGLFVSESDDIIRLVCNDISFNDVDETLGPIQAIAIVANVSSSADSPYCLIDISSATTGSRTPSSLGFSITGISTSGLLLFRSGSV